MAHGVSRAPHLEPGEGDPARTVTIPGGADGRNGAAGRTRPGGITAAEAFRPVLPLQLDGSRRLPGWAVALSVLAVAVIAILVYLLAAQGPAPAPTHSHGGTKAAHRAYVYNVTVSGRA